jgi:3-oxoacyl-[acyl-carrier-protein] synthase II
MRLASSLASHGPALIATLLAPAYGLSRTLKNPALLQSLRSTEHEGYMRVPQAPLTTVGACASSQIAFCEIAPQLLFDYPGYRRPMVVLWAAADAALQPDFGVLDAFGPSALASTRTIEELNANRTAAGRRSIAECLAPFDTDACGTVVGNAGSAVLVTTLDFALRNYLDITSVVVGWGQSGEAGGKGHFAGVGFGGENAIVHALDMAFLGHGYDVSQFNYLSAHATGTRTNSKTELTAVAAGRAAAAARQRVKHNLPAMLVGASKAVGDGHSMGETGLKAVSQAIRFVLGSRVPCIPTLRHVEPDLGSAVDSFVLQSTPVSGMADGGALCVTQGFGGYNGAIALRSANPDALCRYSCDSKVLHTYLERWPQLRRERERRELAARHGPRLALNLAERHRWYGQE